MRLPLVTWNDVFVVVDQGRATPDDYKALGEVVLAGAAAYPRGIGGLVIIPPNAPPPSDGVRAALTTVLTRLGRSLQCMCWSIEGGGFQGAMVRGVITGIKLLARLPYDTHVSTNLNDSLAWTLRRLDGHDQRAPRIAEGVRWIAAKRGEIEQATSSP
jgi:hypothetical protein